MFHFSRLQTPQNLRFWGIKTYGFDSFGFASIGNP
jgi:hypothetical protein